MDKISLYEAIVSSIYEQSKFQHYSSVKIRCGKIVFNTVAQTLALVSFWLVD